MAGLAKKRLDETLLLDETHPEYPTILPINVDLECDSDARIREKAWGASQIDYLSPMFVVRNHGLSPLVDAVLELAAPPLSGAAAPEACVSCEVAGTAEGQRLREALRDNVVARLIDAIAPGYRAGLAAEGQVLDGRISVRCYPNDGSQKKKKGAAGEDPGAVLGPHVDGNILTLLYANGPGLQVPEMPPANPTLTPARIAATGMPTIGPVDGDGGGDGGGAQAPVTWADVGGFWESGSLLVTFGHGWTRTAALQKALPLQCPVLHRVRHGGPPRMSIPYLVRAVDKDDDPTAM